MMREISIRGLVVRANATIGKKNVNAVFYLDVTHSVQDGIEFVELADLAGTEVFEQLKRVSRGSMKDFGRGCRALILAHGSFNLSEPSVCAGVLKEGDEFKAKVIIKKNNYPFDSGDVELQWIQWLK